MASEFELRLDVSIRDKYGSQGLRVSEETTLTELSFLELAEILGRFHHLVTTIQTEKTNRVDS